MTPDAAAQLTLGVLAAAPIAVLLWQIRRSGSLSVWVLSRIVRTFSAASLSQRMHGRCPLPVTGGALLVGNHRSPTDPMVIYSATLLKDGGYNERVVEWLTAREYCDFPGVAGWITETSRSIPVARDGKDMAPVKEALRRLKAGSIVGIFPEGGIYRGEGIGTFDTGAAWLALRAGAPVYPVRVRNTPYCDPILRSFMLRQPADAVFGPQIDFSRWAGRRPTPELLAEVAEYLRGIIANLGNDLPAPDCGSSLAS
ncbi:MAG: 1-acyl-sn-glycerol-3-phosphate acyltransferase [Planctomycetaceae bacterium]|nr:1-acyl-sn-glycerol-3-phosphate acyltransferase [Planctomycetaceae bacterium]